VDFVTSKDGTQIAYERSGSGPAVVLVCGGSVDRQANAPFAEGLAATFTAFNFDRRGRGPSGDTQPYAIAREIEDIAAVIEAAGGEASLVGFSSGASLAMEAAAAGLPVDKLVMWEPPYIVDPAMRPRGDTAKIFHDFVAAGRRDAAVEHFMANVVGMPAEFVEQAKTQPWWAATEALAHTLEYDATVMGDYSVPVDRASQVKASTLVLTGGASFPFMHQAAAALVDAMPNARTQILEGQTHDVHADVFVPAAAVFLAE